PYGSEAKGSQSQVMMRLDKKADGYWLVSTKDRFGHHSSMKDAKDRLAKVELVEDKATSRATMRLLPAGELVSAAREARLDELARKTAAAKEAVFQFIRMNPGCTSSAIEAAANDLGLSQAEAR